MKPAIVKTLPLRISAVPAWNAIDNHRKSLGLTSGSELPAGAFTVKDYMARYKVSDTGADRELRKLVVAGKLVCEKRTVNGHMVNVFWPA